MFEDRGVRAAVTRRAEAVIEAAAVVASNTSTLPSTGLAPASRRPQHFIGLHFFSPVEKMPLVEISVGKHTSDGTLARAFDVVRQVGKTPIVVNDSRGFHTSRVFATDVREGIAMLAEGVHPRRIEVAGLQAGMPMPPLALQDEVSPGLAQHCPAVAVQPPQQAPMDRPMFAQANEAARCHEEGVLRSVADVNIGSVFDRGFVPFHGGALQFINAMGAAAFVARSRALAAKFGPRFAPAAVRVQQAARGEAFVDR